MAKLKLVSKFSADQKVWFLTQDQKVVCGRVVGFQASTDNCIYPYKPQVRVAVDNTVSKVVKKPGIADEHEVYEELCFTSERALITFLKRE